MPLHGDNFISSRPGIPSSLIMPVSHARLFGFWSLPVRNDSQAIQFIDSAAIVETEIIASVSSRFILLLELDLLRLLLARHALSV